MKWRIEKDLPNLKPSSLQFFTISFKSILVIGVALHNMQGCAVQGHLDGFNHSLSWGQNYALLMSPLPGQHILRMHELPDK